MKKLLIACAVVAASIVASAATVDWQYKITAGNADGYENGYNVYLFDATTWASEVASGLTEETWGKALDSTTFKYSKGRTTGTDTWTTLQAGGSAGARTKELTDLAVGDTLDVKYVLVNSNVDPNTYYTQDATLTGRKSNASAITTGYATSTATALGSATWTPVSGGGDVPEPTSGLLLLLGMAGLALRRKLA